MQTSWSAGAPGGYEVEERDVEFLRHDTGALLARMYVPLGEGPFPAVLSVHGGAWTSGDRFNNEPANRALAGTGAVVMSVDFRMPPVAGYPEPVADVHLAIRWLRAHAERYRIDPARIGGIGFSSGGHQLTLAVLRPEDDRYARLPLEPRTPGGSPQARLAFLILCYAVLDPVTRWQMVQAEHRQKLIDSHVAYWGDEATMTEGNPMRILASGEAATLPPALVIQGVVDNNLTPDMADRFGAAYREAGGAAEVLRYEDAPHGFLTRDVSTPAAVTAMERIVRFTHEARSH
ncbi:alpha/beta hydrolase [Rugosimonospora acidiphila]